MNTARVPADVAIEPHTTDVLVLVDHDGAVLGQRWLPAPPEGLLRAEVLTECVVSLAEHARRRDARAQVTRSLGRPPRRPVARTVTVAICTRNRPDMLREAVEALFTLNRPVGILVVDNGSSDDRTEVVCRDLGVDYVREDVPGLSAARNRAIRTTDAELVAFTDDDVFVSPEWLDHIDEAFDDPLVMVATGYLGPFSLEHHAQVQFEAHGGFERHPDHIVFGQPAFPTMTAAAVAGAGGNMVVRRSIVEHLGGFDPAVGPGTGSANGDDKVFFYRVVEAGYRIDYDPRRVVWHRHRSDMDALRSTLESYTTGEFAWTAYMLRTRGDTRALVQWKWWGRHLAGDVRRRLRGGPHAVGLRLTAAEVVGVARAPRAYRSLKGSEDHSRPGGILPAGPAPCFSHRSEPLTWVREAPSISVAIASHNRRDQLARVLSALARQDVPRDRFEVVVVLDGCTDGSGDMVRAFDGDLPLQLIEQEQAGFSGAREAGLAAASHPVALMLDDDIEPLDGWLAAFGARHAEVSRETWVFGNHQPAVGNGFSEQGLRSWWSDHLRRKAQPGHRWTAFDCADGNSSVTLSWFRELGGFDPELARRRQDYELGYRHLQAGGACTFVEEARAAHFLTSGLAADLRIARGEGYGDAYMAVKHPGLIHQLPLASPYVMAPPGRRGALAAALLDDARAVAAADRLERAGQHQAWRRLVSALWCDRYRAGVRERLEELGLSEVPAAPLLRRVPVDLDGDGADAIPADVHAIELVLRSAGRPVGAMPAIRPSHQWDWDWVVDYATGAAMMAAQLPGQPTS